MIKFLKNREKNFFFFYGTGHFETYVVVVFVVEFVVVDDVGGEIFFDLDSVVIFVLGTEIVNIIIPSIIRYLVLTSFGTVDSNSILFDFFFFFFIISSVYFKMNISRADVFPLIVIKVRVYSYTFVYG